MYYLYVLLIRRSPSAKGEFYIGTTNDLRRRVNEHKTNFYKAWTNNSQVNLVYYEAYTNKDFVIEREKRIKKSGSIRTHLIRRIKESLTLW